MSRVDAAVIERVRARYSGEPPKCPVCGEKLVRELDGVESYFLCANAEQAWKHALYSGDGENRTVALRHRKAVESVADIESDPDVLSLCSEVERLRALLADAFIVPPLTWTYMAFDTSEDDGGDIGRWKADGGHSWWSVTETRSHRFYAERWPDPELPANHGEWVESVEAGKRRCEEMHAELTARGLVPALKGGA